MTQPWVVKLNRAQEHLVALANEVGDYEKVNLYLDSSPRASEIGVYDLHFRQAVPPPERWSAMIGDVLHNVRSSLDSFAYLTITRQVQLNSQERGSIYFPITELRSAFQSYRWPADKLGPEIIAAFRRAQPWAKFEGPDVPDVEVRMSVSDDPLLILNRWSNTDKHRGLHMAIAAPADWFVGLPESVGAKWVPGDAWPWSDGTLIGTWSFTGFKPGEGPGFGNKFRIAIEPDASPDTRWSFHDRLGGIIMAARLAIDQVESGLPRQA